MTAEDVPKLLDEYVYYFNNNRPAAALSYKSPVQYKTELGFQNYGVFICLLSLDKCIFGTIQVAFLFVSLIFESIPKYKPSHKIEVIKHKLLAILIACKTPLVYY